MAKIQNSGSIFTSVQKKRQKRSNFNLSHDVKLSLDMGKLVPTYIQEVIPGDKTTISTSSMLRFAPLISPVMHKVKVYQEFFFVPNRILWGNWETFITGSRNGKQLSQDELPAFPVVNPYAFGQNEGQPTNMVNGTSSLVDYLGLPTRDQFPVEEIEPGVWSSPLNSQTKVSALPFAAYQRIYDEYYRDENLMTSLYEDETDGWENYNQLTDGQQPIEIQQALAGIRVRAWEHDYFTSALPWAQKGEEVTIPFDPYMAAGSTAEFIQAYANQSPDNVDDLNDLNLILKNTDSSSDPDTRQKYRLAADDGVVDKAIQLDNTEAMQQSATINDLRAAVKLQEWLETNARGGSRYFESIYAHFGVQSPDSRLQRPEFIGSHRSNMIISEVLQTSSAQSENDTPQGNMSGHGQSVSQSKTFNYYAQEHGYIIGLISVLPKTAYQQGIPKHFLKTGDRLDYYFPEFAHLGEQEIKNAEIYAAPSEVNDYDPNDTFGYTPRYSEYKFINSRVAGDFRDTLDFWHLGRIFDTPPSLNDFFIGSNPSKRIFAVQDIPNDGSGENASIRDYDSIYAHVFHDVKANRLMPKYGTPTLG